MNGRPSQGIRRSCRCSDSQKVHTSGKSAIRRMVSSAGRTSPQASRASCASTPRTESALGSGSSGAEADSIEQVLHVGLGPRQRGLRAGLPSQRAVQVDLENFRELVVYRRDRPGHSELDHPRLPAELRERLRSWVDENAAGERKSGDTNEQFYYKARKKAIGPFKQDLWSLPEEIRGAIAGDLEKTFAFLFEQLNVNGTQDQVNRFIQAPIQHHAALKPVLVAAADDPDAGE